MAHQVLCIESATRHDGSAHVTKGIIYNSISCSPNGIPYKGVDLWHQLKELHPFVGAHVSLFVDLPNQEGQSFSNVTDKPVKIEKEEVVEQEL